MATGEARPRARASLPELLCAGLTVQLNVQGSFCHAPRHTPTTEKNFRDVFVQMIRSHLSQREARQPSVRLLIPTPLVHF